MAGEGLSTEQYWAEVKRLGLRSAATAVSNHVLHVTAAGEFVSVRLPDDLTPNQRYQAIERIKRYLGIEFPLYRGPRA